MLKSFDRDYFVALLLLLPGFLSLQTMLYFGGSLPGRGGDFQTITTSLAFSLINFVIVLGFYELSAKMRAIADSEQRSLTSVSPGFIAGLVVVAVLTGTAAAWVDRSGIIYKVISPTARVSQSRPWVVLWEQCQPTWAQVTLRDGKTYLGFVNSFSDDASITELVLDRVYRIDESGERSKLKAERLLLFGSNISSIEVMPVGDDNPCAAKNE